MKVILYNAISLDGFLARSNGSTDWVADEEEWLATCRETGCVVIGKKTYDEIGAIEGVNTLVLTHNTGNNEQNLKFVSSTAEAVKAAQDAGFDKILLCGGSDTNASFAREGLIDEMIADIHPLLLATGKRWLGNYEGTLELELLDSKTFKGFVQNHYKVIVAR